MFVPALLCRDDRSVEVGRLLCAAEFIAASSFACTPQPGQATVVSCKSPWGEIPVCDVGGVTRSVVAQLDADFTVERFIVVSGLSIRCNDVEFDPLVISEGDGFARISLLAGHADAVSFCAARAWCREVNELAPELRNLRRWRLSIVDRGAIVDVRDD